ncbi:hypothetical protein EG829_20505, partial [bacterium]|nr:hypothetical protein [bacterium]
GNLMQLGLCLQMYVQEERCYPVATCGGGLGSWPRAMGPGSSEALLFCPEKIRAADVYVSMFKFPSSRIHPHYGYNYVGAVRRNAPHPSLGLGGDFIWGEKTGKYVATPESAVRFPARMLAIGDSDASVFLPADPENPPSYTNLLHIAFPHTVPYLGRPGVGDWHNGSALMLFCDGHVESAKQSAWTEASALRRQLWNNDNLPHEECW